MATAATALFPMVADVNITSNANGCAAAGVLSSLDTYSNTFVASTLAATNTLAPMPQKAQLLANCAKARVTGIRVTLRYIGPEGTTAGQLFVGNCAQPDNTVRNGPITSFTPYMRQYALVPGGEWTFYLPMFSNSPDFEDLAATRFQNDHWGGLAIIIAGVSASATLMAMRINASVEYIPELSFYTMVTSESEPYDPVGLAEAGYLAGVGVSGPPQTTLKWSPQLKTAVASLLQGGTAVAAVAARAWLQNHMRDRMMPAIM